MLWFDFFLGCRGTDGTGAIARSEDESLSELQINGVVAFTASIEGIAQGRPTAIELLFGQCSQDGIRVEHTEGMKRVSTEKHDR